MHDIVIDNISKSFGDVRVFDGFSAVLEKGRIYRLTAPSGAGKTTLLRMLMRLEMPDSGSIAGIPRDISAVFQEDRLLDEMSVYNNIALASDMPMRSYKRGLRGAHCGRKCGAGPDANTQTVCKEQSEESRVHCEKTAEDRITAALGALGIAEYADKPASELSGGMKRRTALIRAMLHASELVLLDEPFTGLDDEARSRAAEYILTALNGRTCVIASHIIEPCIEARSVEIFDHVK